MMIHGNKGRILTALVASFTISTATPAKFHLLTTYTTHAKVSSRSFWGYISVDRDKAFLIISQ
jgi:hypothetical protein